MTYKQTEEAYNAVQELLKHKDLTMAGGLKLRPLARALKTHVEDYQEEHKKVLTEHLLPDEQGNPQVNKEGGILVKAEYHIKLKELSDIEVDGIPTIKASVLGNLVGVGIHLYNLHDSLVDDLDD